MAPVERLLTTARVAPTSLALAQVSPDIVYEQQEVQSYLNELCTNLHMSLSAAMTIAEI